MKVNRSVTRVAMLDLFVDADGCPVKEEVYRVAKRYGLQVYVVANAILRTPASAMIESVTVKGDLNAADDWIVEHVQKDDVVVTADVPLADRCLQKGAAVLSSNGRPFTDKTIGDSLATRELMQGLRQSGVVTGGPAAFRPSDRSRFLSALDEVIQRIRRKHP